MRDEDIETYWDRYAALSFREKIREGGVVRWLNNTNTGVLLALALGMALLTITFAVAY